MKPERSPGDYTKHANQQHARTKCHNFHVTSYGHLRVKQIRNMPKLKNLADLTQLEMLLQEHPLNKFLVTTLAKENAHTLAVMARKFSNLMPFGCWWFVNNPSIIAEITDFRLEML